MFNKLKQIKDLRNQAKKMQDTLGQETIEATDRWNNVKITMDGNMKIKSVEIDPQMLDQAGKARLEENVKEAFNNAVKKTQKIMASKMRDMGGLDGLNLPGM